MPNIESLTISIIFILILYWVIRRLSQLFFQPLTSYWFTLGFTISFGIGSALFYSLVYLDIVILSENFFEIALKYFPLSWLLGLIPLNLLVLPCLYWRDKVIAKKQDDKLLRIPENALHALAFCGGYLGAWIGQNYFNHKVSKSSFQKKHYLISIISISLYILATYAFFKK